METKLIIYQFKLDSEAMVVGLAFCLAIVLAVWGYSEAKYGKK
jgi:hypothetical protein